MSTTTAAGIDGVRDRLNTVDREGRRGNNQTTKYKKGQKLKKTKSSLVGYDPVPDGLRLKDLISRALTLQSREGSSQLGNLSMNTKICGRRRSIDAAS